MDTKKNIPEQLDEQMEQFDVISFEMFEEDTEGCIDDIKKSDRPTMIREPDGSGVVALGWDQYQALVSELEPLAERGERSVFEKIKTGLEEAIEYERREKASKGSAQD